LHSRFFPDGMIFGSPAFFFVYLPVYFRRNGIFYVQCNFSGEAPPLCSCAILLSGFLAATVSPSSLRSLQFILTVYVGVFPPGSPSVVLPATPHLFCSAPGLLAGWGPRLSLLRGSSSPPEVPRSSCFPPSGFSSLLKKRLHSPSPMLLGGRPRRNSLSFSFLVHRCGGPGGPYGKFPFYAMGLF